MNRALGLALLIGGIVLLVFGLQANHSFSSDVSRTFTGNPTDRTIWMLVVGVILAVVGFVFTLRGGSGTKM